MGLAGAAFANVLAQSAGTFINLFMLFSGRTRMHLTLSGFRLDWGIIRGLIRIGAPASASGMERALLQLILLKIVSPFGDVAVAAYGIVRRLEMFIGYGGEGVGMATGIMVGQNLGAKNPERAKRSVGWGVVFVTAFKLLADLPLIIIPSLIVFIFTKEPEVVSLTSTWLRLLALAALFMGGSNVLTQAFNVAGDTLTVMFVTLLTVIIELPLAWLLCYPLGIGPLGIAWAGIAGMAIRVAIMVPLYFRGSWLKRKVI
ncbi:MAG: hypothetical protein HY529_01965 [Chloroflexi bacterium]|nr:hypothetical protein [Chloroflexota bacterium]